MPILIKPLLLIICLTKVTAIKADMWQDPTWKDMLDNSDVIAMVQYTKNGKFRARAKIVTSYKGTLQTGDEIWIWGFSNRYGPVDRMYRGDRYIVFLKFDKPDSNGIDYLNNAIKRRPGLKRYAEAYKNGKTYQVWSPTSGDLRIKNNEVQYDLVETTFYKNQNYFSLIEFESFLREYQVESKAEFCKGLLTSLKPATENEKDAQTLMKLHLLGYDRYDSVFRKYIKSKNPASRYALAMIMGNIGTSECKDILKALLSDRHGLVQGEAVRQLKKVLPSDSIAPLLLAHLVSQNEKHQRHSNIMNPVANIVNDGKFEIIKALGEMKYKPAVPQLLLLLDFDDREIFNVVSEALMNIGMQDSATITLLLSNYRYFLQAKDSMPEPTYRYRNYKYIETFAYLRINEARPLIYQTIYERCGLNYDFGKHPALFNKKKQLEDSFKGIFENSFGQKGYKLDYCLAFIENTNEVASGLTPQVKYLIGVTIPSNNNGREHRQLLGSELKIPEENTYIRYKDGAFRDMPGYDRFYESNLSTLIGYFSDYAFVVPTREDAIFLEKIIENKIITNEYYLRKVKEIISEIRKSQGK